MDVLLLLELLVVPLVLTELLELPLELAELLEVTLELAELLDDEPLLLTEVELRAGWVAFLYEVGVVVAALLIVKVCELLLS